MLDPNATGAPTPLPSGAAGREDHERAAAIARRGGETRLAGTRGAEPDWLVQVPASRLFMILAENVRDYAMFLMDADGIIRYWGEGARLMKWWTKEEAEGSHLRLLYLNGGSEDGTAEALGYARMLEREGLPENQYHAFIARLQNNGTYLMQVVNDLLDMTRIEAGQMGITSVLGRLGDALDAALSEVQPQASVKGVELLNHVSGYAAELPYWGDELRLRQILINLLSNAIKFTPAGGQVTVSGGSAQRAVELGEGPWVYVRVEDTGCGIPAERLSSIFEPYSQAQARHQNQGAGLGLSISRRLARLMGGEISVRSEVGVGSEFILWLPCGASVSPQVPR